MYLCIANIRMLCYSRLVLASRYVLEANLPLSLIIILFSLYYCRCKLNRQTDTNSDSGVGYFYHDLGVSEKNYQSKDGKCYYCYWISTIIAIR